MVRSRARARVATLVGLAGVYVVAGKLGLSLALVHASASAVWPPTGIALAAFLVFGRSVWPAILAGAFLVNLSTAGNAATSLAIAAGNTLEGLAGAALAVRFAGGREAFERPRNVFAFIALAGLVATAISPTIGVTSLCLGSFARWEEFLGIWLTWWLGDAGGAIVVAPALVLWSMRPRPGFRPAQWLEASALLLVIGGVGAVAFGDAPALVAREGSLAFACLPPVIWAAFRFGPRETAGAVLLLSAIAVRGTLRGTGPFPGAHENESLLILQLFMGVVSATGLSLAAIVGQHRRSLAELERQAAELARSNAALAEFAHVVSHDLKAPLRGIASLAGWIARDCEALLPVGSKEHLALLGERVKRMGRLIDGVLGQARAGRGARAPELLDAKRVADEVVDSLAPPRGVSVRVEGPLPQLRYDRTHLTQVLQNLIQNSVEHLGRSEGEVVVSCLERSSEFEFSVRDDGPGIASESSPGVGLAIVTRIVESHGGRVRAESSPGRGATFRFTVPKPPHE
jgi:signal transduction histidine kinase